MTDSAGPALPKRFYKDVAVATQSDGFAVTLDGRLAKAGSGAPLTASTRALADAVAAEWSAVDDAINLKAMPVTRLVGAARASGVVAACAETLNAYLQTDLVCFPAAEPAALVAAQEAAWTPYRAAFAARYGAALKTTTGLQAPTQDAGALAAVQARIAACGAETGAAMRAACETAGSAVLALSLLDDASEDAARRAFTASRVDETYQAERWGRDAEADAREALMARDFLAAACVVRLAAA